MKRTLKERLLVVMDNILEPIKVRPIKVESTTPTDVPGVFTVTTSYRGETKATPVATFSDAQCDRIAEINSRISL